MNSVILSGIVGRNLQFYEATGGDGRKVPILRFDLGVEQITTERHRPEGRWEWHRIILFDKQALGFKSKIHVGDKVFVHGKLSSRIRDKVRHTSVICYRLEFAYKV